MKIFGLVITTASKYEMRDEKLELDKRRLDLDIREQTLSNWKASLYKQQDGLEQHRRELLKEVEEAKADLILREMAKVMGGHWNGVGR